MKEKAVPKGFLMHSLGLARLKGKTYSIRQVAFFQSCCLSAVVRFDSNVLSFFEFSPTPTHFIVNIVLICDFNLQIIDN